MTYTMLDRRRRRRSTDNGHLLFIYLRAFLGRGAGKRLSLELRLYIREGDVVVYPQNEYPVLNQFSDCYKLSPPS